MDATRFVEEIVTLGVASREQIDAAAQQPSTWRTLPARLVEFGYDRADVLSAVSVAVGLPPAPPAILRAAFAPSTGVSVDAWRSVIACPVLASDGVVLLTTSVEAVGQAQSWGVNPARVFAVLEPDVEDVLVGAEALGVNPGVVVHDAMGQIELASADAGVDVIGLPGAPVDVGSLGSSASLELDLEGRSARAPAFGGVEGAPAAVASDVVVSAVANRDPTTGSLAALSDDSGDDSALEGAAAAGQQLCGHDIYEELGRGASAVVFRARRPGESYDVALKIITKETARNPAFPQRFKREIRAQASLTHANIVRVIDYGREDGWYFLATEYLPGGTLEDLVAESGPLPGAVAVCVLDEVLRGIAFAQTRGVVHRDLKPGNLLLGADGRIKIGDFGLARMDLDPNKSSFGTVQGTPAYMSPEQALGLDIDGRSDLFTLATIVYELVTGTNPYRRELGPATLMAVAQAKSLSLFDVLPNVPLELDEAVHRMSHKETERRPASADEVLAILAPAVEMTRRRWPDLLPTYLRAPLDTATRLNAQLADEEVARARAILASDDEKLRASAALAIGRALTHRPDHAEAHAMWAQLVEAGFSGGDALKPDLIAVEQQLADAPDDPRLLRRASELARGEGNVLKQAAYLRRYLRLGQKDTLAVHQLSLLLSSDATVPVPAPALAAGRIATPATSPMASSPGFPVAPSASSAALPIQEAPSPSAPPAQAIPSARAPRVVGTGAETQSISTPRPSRGGLAALLGVVLLGCVLVAAWFLLADDVKGMIEGAAEEQVEERIDENTGAGPRVVNPFEQRQRGTLREARAHVSAGRLDEAIDAFTTAIDIDPGSTQAMQGWLGRADAYARRGDKETATKQYQRVLELTSEGAFGHAEAKAALKALGSPVGE